MLIVDQVHAAAKLLRVVLLPLLGKRDTYQSEKFMRGYRFLEAELQDRDRVKSGRYVEICSVSLKKYLILN